MGFEDAGVGRPRGRGLFNLNVPGGDMIAPCIKSKDIFAFSLLSFFPVLRFAHPKAFRLVLDVTRCLISRTGAGRGVGGSPKTFCGANTVSDANGNPDILLE